jgi:hypothetical protein
MKESINGRGRAIAIDKNGIFGKEVNSNAMVWATMDDNELQYDMIGKNIRNEAATFSPEKFGK